MVGCRARYGCRWRRCAGDCRALGYPLSQPPPCRRADRRLTPGIPATRARRSRLNQSNLERGTVILKTWQKFLIPTLITLAIGGLYLFIVFKHRQNPGIVGQQQPTEQLTADDVAVVRMEFPQHFEDVLNLQGKSVWMKNGYSMSYFPYTGGRVEFAKKAGLIPA